jgi:hypothetical protein
MTTAEGQCMSRLGLPHFPTTRWSLVLRTGDENSGIRRQALGELLRDYLRPMRYYLLTRQRLATDAADDLLQGFLCERVLEENLVPRARQQRGKFRTFLLTALDHYVALHFRRNNAPRREPERAAVSLDEVPAPPDTSADPAEAFDRVWARGVLDLAVRRMRRECRESFRHDLWAVFQARVLEPALSGVEAVAYEQVADRMALASPAEAANLLVTAKRMFARNLRAVIADYVQTEAEIDQEVAELRTIVSRGGAGGSVTASLLTAGPGEEDAGGAGDARDPSDAGDVGHAGQRDP